MSIKIEGYRGLVRFSLYIAKQTRPDLLANMMQFTLLLENHGRMPWGQQKGFFLIWRAAKDRELCYNTKDADGVTLYGSADTDLNWDLDDRTSTNDYSFHLQKIGVAIIWSTKKQSPVAISTNEAEYQAIAAAIQEALYLLSLLDEKGVVNDGPTVIKEENQG